MSVAEDRYERFAREYVIDLNATRAAIAAGYSEKRADQAGSRLLRTRKVAKWIQKLQSDRASRLGVKADRVLEEVHRLAFSNMADFTEADDEGRARGINLSHLTRDQMAAVQEIREDTRGGSGDGERRLVLRTTLKLADKTKNLELLMRHLGMLNDKIAVTGLEGLAERLAEARKNKSIANG